jgi:hypothetical protein
MAQRKSNIAWQQEAEQNLEPEGNYHARWQAFTLRRTIALFFVYTWVPLCVGLFWLSRHLIHMPVASLLVMAAWLGLAVTTVWWAGEFRCPRCSRRYAALGHRSGDANLTRGIFDRVCANCKLRKFENG